MSYSIQLYTLRTHLADDLEGTIARVAQIGYPLVEPYQIVAETARLGAALTANGLKAPSTHAPLLGEQQEEVLAAAQQLGIGTVICPATPAEKWKQAGDIEQIAESLNAAAARAAEYGLRVGYHNHWWELGAVNDRSGLEHLAEHLEPEVILEIDTYWAAVAGRDPIDLITTLGDRVRFLHLKDGPVNEVTTDQLALGKGVMPVRQILDAAAHLEVGVVELDDHDGDMFTAVEQSLQFLTDNAAGNE